eukprot:g33434.t1
MTDNYVEIGALLVNRGLFELVEKEISVGTGFDAQKFFNSLSSVVEKMANRNRAFLKKRDAIQAQIDAYLLERRGQAWDAEHYAQFLTSIGYLLPPPAPFKVRTQNVDPEISSTPGPQLVVPIDNARYALNAANARWGSLLDALYGTNVIPETDGAEQGSSYNPVRGARVFQYAFQFLDQTFPLEGGARFEQVVGFTFSGGMLRCAMSNGQSVALASPAQFVGYQEKKEGGLSNIFFKHHGLHVELQINPNSLVGKTNTAGVSDILMEAAVSTIADMEDSVAAADAEDKCNVYRNWAGLVRGTLVSTFEKGGKTVTRRLNEDKQIITPEGKQATLAGRSVLLVRNVGMHMYTDMVLLRKTHEQVPEAMVDAMMSALAAIPDLRKGAQGMNSRRGSMYIVKPKMHGPDEVGFNVELMGLVEKELGLPANTIKMGVMDEERRTTVNLSECIHRAADRCIFINTGFLDRTGDEIHTSMEAGPMMCKHSVKKAIWKEAYELWNVDVGLACGLNGVGQIGKGMWAKPDEMKEMLATKMAEPKAGATTAWVPSPTGATLHAMHYHQVDVVKVQAEIKAGGPRSKLSDLLLPPLLTEKLDAESIQKELENNCQGLLGYVVRWVQQGVGCSKVPDRDDVGLMEDRATLRINAQHVYNWWRHGVISKKEVMDCLEKMATLVDRQNRKDPLYQNMAPDFNNLAFQCACRLVFGGGNDPNGYTEFALSEYRRATKLKAKIPLPMADL